MKEPWNQISIGWVSILLLPAMMLLTPFLIFLVHFSYDWADSSTLSSLAIIISISLLCSFMMIAGGRIGHSLIIAGLLTFFVDIQFELIEGFDWLAKYVWSGTAIGVFTISWVLKENFFRIATAIFTVFFVVTLGQALLPNPVSDLHFGKSPPGTVGQSLPRIIHLVLDAHIGIEGIPQDSALGQQMKADLKSFYQKNGFVVFGGAYSHYPLTLRSIPHLLNFSASPDEATPQGDPFFVGREPYTLLENRYFELLSSRGYKLNVLADSVHFDYCSGSAVVIDNCLESALSGMALLKGSDLVLVDKLRVVFSHFFSLGYTVKGISYAYADFREVLSEKGVDLPPWDWSTQQPLMPLSSLQAFDTLSEKIATLPVGNFVYSHLMVPHEPYVLRRDCSLNLSLDQWKGKWDPALKPKKNTLFSREERYRLYFHQLKCVYKKLDTLFEQMRKGEIYKDSIIILHGDHGSRIGRFGLSPKNLEYLSKRDLEDYFSTLFAVKLPDVKEHYSVKRKPIEVLLAETIFLNVEIINKMKEPEAFFFFWGEKEKARKPIKFPENW
jgi:hypothetical protein